MSRWRCRRYRARLVDAAEGQRLREPRMAQHLVQCADCRRELEALRQVPATLRTSAVPDPGEEFWLRQRQAIGRSIRNLPTPRAQWNLEWLSEALRAWRYPVAVAASALVAVLVLRSVHAPQPMQPDVLQAQIAALDPDSVEALHDLTKTLVSPEESLTQLAGADPTQLAELPLDELVGVTVPPDVPTAGDLSDSELDRVDTLLGGLG